MAVCTASSFLITDVWPARTALGSRRRFHGAPVRLGAGKTGKLRFTLSIRAATSEETSDDVSKQFGEVLGDLKEKPGSIIPYRVKVALIADVPVFGKLTLPLEKTGEIPVPYKPDVDLDKVEFDNFSFEETSATLHLKLENKNDFDLGLNALDYEIWLADVSIGGAQLAKSSKLDKNGISYIELPISFRPKDFGSAL